MNSLSRFLFVVALSIPCSIQALPTESSEALPSTGKEHGKPVSPYMLGLNLSYFNDLDDIWENYDIPEKLEKMGVRVLRYPGGEETSRWHWDQPGVNGYVDVWNPDNRNQRWQSTWVSPELWDLNEAFMDVDEYFAYCEQIGTEPLLGINMSAGEVNNRREDGIAQAVALIKHVKKRGYPLRYVYLDNEPWHKHSSNYYLFPGDDYAELCVLYARALRTVDPDLQFIANAYPSGQIENRGKVQHFLDIAGKDIDVIEVHFYWEWGRSNWDLWTSQLPMLNSSQWRDTEQAKTFTEDIENLRRIIADHGYPAIKLAVLEWNIAPPKNNKPPEHWQTSLMQAEMLMQFIDAEAWMTALWPTFWQVTPPDQATETGPRPDNGSFRSVFEHQPPYATTPTYDMLQFFAEISGSDQTESFFEEPGLYRQSYLLGDGTVLILALNKSSEDLPLSLLPYQTRPMSFERLGSAGKSQGEIKDTEDFTLPGYSLTCVRVSP